MQVQVEEEGLIKKLLKFVKVSVEIFQAGIDDNGYDFFTGAQDSGPLDGRPNVGS